MKVWSFKDSYDINFECNLDTILGKFDIKVWKDNIVYTDSFTSTKAIGINTLIQLDREDISKSYLLADDLAFKIEKEIGINRPAINENAIKKISDEIKRQTPAGCSELDTAIKLIWGLSQMIVKLEDENYGYRSIMQFVDDGLKGFAPKSVIPPKTTLSKSPASIIDITSWKHNKDKN